MTRFQRFALVCSVALAVIGLALMASTARADSVRLQGVALTPADGAAVPPLHGDLADGQVIDAEEFAALSDITQRITPYISLGADGLPRLADIRAEDLGVDEAFLADFRAAMDFANQAIVDGRIAVAPDLTVTALDLDVRADPSRGLVGTVSGGQLGAGPIGGAIGAGGDEIQWGTWHYPQGAMFYNSYSDYWSYYYNRYYVLCNSMAASLGFPWLSTNLIYFYAYNGSYFSNNCYRDLGTYYFLPYSTTCQAYNPCWCCGMSYRPVYFWVRTTAYDYYCGCYRYNWAWQGYWGRY